MIPIKRGNDIESMRKACRIAANVLDRLACEVKAGVNTYDLDQRGRELIASYGATSACYDYRVGLKRYPAYTCLSVNEEIVHGIGDIHRVLRDGDVITLDVCIDHEGWIGDNARTIVVGEASEEVSALLKTTSEALDKAIAFARPGRRIGDISNLIQKFVEGHGFGIVRDFVGHGVGKSMHEEPQIPNFGLRGTGPKLKAGMTLAIEPMVTLGDPRTKILSDGWTAVTVDQSPSAHFEHTVLITDKGSEILTLPNWNKKTTE